MNHDLNAQTTTAAYALLRAMTMTGPSDLPPELEPGETASVGQIVGTAYDMLLADPGVIDHAPPTLASRLYDVVVRLSRPPGSLPLEAQNLTTRRLYLAVAVTVLTVTEEYLVTLGLTARASA